MNEPFLCELRRRPILGIGLGISIGLDSVVPREAPREKSLDLDRPDQASS